MPAVLLSVLIEPWIAGDERSDRRKSVQVLSVYLIIDLTLFVAPEAPAH
jgi:hypothetical protein